jgi:hypothetical protein
VKSVVNEQTIWRICTDYRELNRRIKKNSHPLPNVINQIQRAAGHGYYCFIDLKDGFWHIRIREKDREKIAFVTPFGIYEWTHMPFSLTNAPATFQAFMNEVLNGLQEFVAGLLDDIIVWADDLHLFYKRVSCVFARLFKYGLMFNIQKSVMFVEKGVFLGFVISRDDIAADPQKVAAIRDKPMPAITIEVKAFVNAAGYLRHLISRYANFANLLTEFINKRKNVPVKLLPEAKAAWRIIRNQIIILPIIQPFD